MSIKFRMDGAVFPTEVRSGSLFIKVGNNTIPIQFPFLKEDYAYDNTEFPMSNIMCYLKNDTSITIMRFDGTVTRYNNSGEVIGFSKFNVEDVTSRIVYYPVGTVLHLNTVGAVDRHTECSIYIAKGSDGTECILECVGDPEPIVFNTDNNKAFVEEFLKGTRYFPRLVKKGDNTYADDSGNYVVDGEPIKITASVFI